MNGTLKQVNGRLKLSQRNKMLKIKPSQKKNPNQKKVGST
jgi:hypothetical protein